MKNENPKLERVLEKPIKVFGKQLKVLRVILAASVGVLYTGTLFNETQSLTPLIFTVMFGIVLIIAGLLMMKKILYFPTFNLECSSAGDVFITKLEGICPTCKGSLKIKTKNKVKVIQCDKDKNHTWNLKEK
jgi:hypothetical protein